MHIIVSDSISVIYSLMLRWRKTQHCGSLLRLESNPGCPWIMRMRFPFLLCLLALEFILHLISKQKWLLPLKIQLKSPFRHIKLPFLIKKLICSTAKWDTKSLRLLWLEDPKPCSVFKEPRPDFYSLFLFFLWSKNRVSILISPLRQILEKKNFNKFYLVV